MRNPDLMDVGRARVPVLCAEERSDLPVTRLYTGREEDAPAVIFIDCITRRAFVEYVKATSPRPGQANLERSPAPCPRSLVLEADELASERRGCPSLEGVAAEALKPTRVGRTAHASGRRRVDRSGG